MILLKYLMSPWLWRIGVLYCLLFVVVSELVLALLAQLLVFEYHNLSILCLLWDDTLLHVRKGVTNSRGHWFWFLTTFSFDYLADVMIIWLEINSYILQTLNIFSSTYVKYICCWVQRLHTFSFFVLFSLHKISTYF